MLVVTATKPQDGPVDPLRERLLDAAARLGARQGYQGLNIQEIVKEAGLSTGAVYGRFTSKDELVREAIITRAVPQGPTPHPDYGKIADWVRHNLTVLTPGLSDRDALLLEAYVTARRDPVVADALASADEQLRDNAAPDVAAAVQDGTIKGLDPKAVLFFVRVMRLGLLLHRGSGLEVPDQENWDAVMDRVISSWGR
jgi:AcrR family transcriptional regulator